MNLIEAKKTYGDLYCIKFDDLSVVFRLLTWSEYKRYREMLAMFENNNFLVYELVYDDCVIESEIDNNEKMDAGIISSVSSGILSMSGANSIEDMLTGLEQFRSFAEYDYEERLSSILVQTFHISLDELGKKTWPELLRMISHLELIMSGNIPQFPIVTSSSQQSHGIDFEKENRELKEEL